MDLNVRIIQAVECCPLLYKGHTTIEERQTVWQQISHQLCVPETLVKSRWHILCGYYQRCLEKLRSKDEEGAARSDFRYEKEMEFMMPYVHARIAIAAADNARKQQELAAASNRELADPEFVITERDLEEATRIVNSQKYEEYVFYDVETLDGEDESAQAQQYQQHINENMHGCVNGEEEETHQQNLKMVERINEEIEEEVIEEVDESENIVQDLIIESGELVTDDSEQIVVEEEEVLQMDDEMEIQTETVIEEILEENQSLENDIQAHTDSHMSSSEQQLPTNTVYIQNDGERRVLCVSGSTNNERKFAKILQETTPVKSTLTSIKQEIEEPQQQIEQHTPSFTEEYSVLTRRRHAVVLKATPRVQVELTDNAVANATNNIDSQQTVVANAILIHNKNDVHDSSIVKQEKHSFERRCSNSYENSIDHDNRSNDSNVITTTASENEENRAPKRKRSEDTIFGELVTAMLKHMPQERKRSIKKSIMDLLLT